MILQLLWNMTTAKWVLSLCTKDWKLWIDRTAVEIKSQIWIHNMDMILIMDQNARQTVYSVTESIYIFRAMLLSWNIQVFFFTLTGNHPSWLGAALWCAWATEPACPTWLFLPPFSPTVSSSLPGPVPPLPSLVFPAGTWHWLALLLLTADGEDSQSRCSTPWLLQQCLFLGRERGFGIQPCSQEVVSPHLKPPHKHHRLGLGQGDSVEVSWWWGPGHLGGPAPCPLPMHSSCTLLGGWLPGAAPLCYLQIPACKGSCCQGRWFSHQRLLAPCHQSCFWDETGSQGEVPA